MKITIANECIFSTLHWAIQIKYTITKKESWAREMNDVENKNAQWCESVCEREKSKHENEMSNSRNEWHLKLRKLNFITKCRQCSVHRKPFSNLHTHISIFIFFSLFLLDYTTSDIFMSDFSIFDCCYFIDSFLWIKIDVGFYFLCVCVCVSLFKPLWLA